MKDLKESIYHGAVVNALAVDLIVLGKSLKKGAPHLLESLMLGIV